ncbi:hypothetical protein APY04_1428 [Hyphomicrobium sulfonivorans]|uniref:Uncharacterized protein n=1 Tax=Hyphomicrobium sulfonivorans TaxID=121290 RepID=A0A125NVC2_HYPSL|nr:hypothetical protein APY04_1428 [Hyphomicrobium sulfonivorans]
MKWTPIGVGARASFAALGAALVIGLVLALDIFGSATPAEAGQCGVSCRNAYNQCRMSTKGSPSCEVAFTRCMQSCIKR